jgi:hypothetical protein
MRLIIFITILLVCCHQPQKQHTASTPNNQKDSTQINYQYDTLLISKEDSAGLTNFYPAFKGDTPTHPDSLYEAIGPIVKYRVADNTEKRYDFRSESGHDVFNIHYAYFIKNKNNFIGADTLRQQLTDAAHLLKDIFLSLESFGTYYAHQHRRIYGYVEYWLLTYKKPTSKCLFFEKQQFISALQSYIKAAVAKNNNIPMGEEKIVRTKELLNDVDKLSLLLNNGYVFATIKNYRESNYPATFIP